MRTPETLHLSVVAQYGKAGFLVGVRTYVQILARSARSARGEEQF